MCLLVLGMLFLLRSNPQAQGTIRVSSVHGPVERKTSVATGFVPFSSSSLPLNVGDRVRTGPGGTLTLELLDGAFMIVYQNSTITIHGQSEVLHSAIWRKAQSAWRWNSDGPYRGSWLKLFQFADDSAASRYSNCSDCACATVPSRSLKYAPAEIPRDALGGVLSNPLHCKTGSLVVFGARSRQDLSISTATAR
jgi:hypothetical protein